MTTVSLNLARKWRSKTFEHIVGQDLSVKILKNSLYKGAFFPVYLFAGQRGCGKTSTARVFAAALNCKKLSEFQSSPRAVCVPCLSCESCVAMMSGRHPDFFEIDAASHTGVDNVRQILDASTLMPLMGSRKIYLIDEAHMLSKASFNAFLKILEEPPDSVLFVLATTDPQKIIETVRSRCLQLYFKPVDADVLVAHLKYICKKEGIKSTADGLHLIVRESQGSVRDALNILEQVRFASSVVSSDCVRQVLGHCNKDILIHLLRVTFCGTAHELLKYMEDQKLSLFSHDHLWNEVVQLIRLIGWVKHDIAIDEPEQVAQGLRSIASVCSLTEIISALSLFYHNESIVSRVSSKYALLEMILLQIIQRRNNTNSESGAVSSCAPVLPAEAGDNDTGEEECEDECTMLWQSFLSRIEETKDPLVQSIFKQSQCFEFVRERKIVRIGFSKKLIFFNDWLADSKAIWHTYFQSVFGNGVELEIEFTDAIKYTESMIAKSNNASQAAVSTNVVEKKIAQTTKTTVYSPKQSWGMRKQTDISWETVFDVKKIGVLDVSSEKEKWKRANTILEYFPGTVYEIVKRSE